MVTYGSTSLHGYIWHKIILMYVANWPALTVCVMKMSKQSSPFSAKVMCFSRFEITRCLTLSHQFCVLSWLEIRTKLIPLLKAKKTITYFAMRLAVLSHFISYKYSKKINKITNEIWMLVRKWRWHLGNLCELVTAS